MLVGNRTVRRDALYKSVPSRRRSRVTVTHRGRPRVVVPAPGRGLLSAARGRPARRVASISVIIIARRGRSASRIVATTVVAPRGTPTIQIGAVALQVTSLLANKAKTLSQLAGATIVSASAVAAVTVTTSPGGRPATGGSASPPVVVAAATAAVAGPVAHLATLPALIVLTGAGLSSASGILRF